jgi:hypothetical protein
MDAFPAERSARADQLEALQEGVTAALERLSKLSAISGGAMPSKGQFQEMQVGVWVCEVLYHLLGNRSCCCIEMMLMCWEGVAGGGGGRGLVVKIPGGCI